MSRARTWLTRASTGWTAPTSSFIRRHFVGAGDSRSVPPLSPDRTDTCLSHILRLLLDTEPRRTLTGGILDTYYLYRTHAHTDSCTSWNSVQKARRDGSIYPHTIQKLSSQHLSCSACFLILIASTAASSDFCSRNRCSQKNTTHGIIQETPHSKRVQSSKVTDHAWQHPWMASFHQVQRSNLSTAHR